MPEITFQAAVIKELMALDAKIEKLNPDAKHNVGRSLGSAAFWDYVATYAEKQSKIAWKALIEEEVITDPTKKSEGEYNLATSPSFTVTLKVSAPRKQFDVEKLAVMLKKKYKVPEPITKDFVEKSKSAGSSNRTLKIIERG